MIDVYTIFLTGFLLYLVQLIALFAVFWLAALLMAPPMRSLFRSIVRMGKNVGARI